MDSCKPVREGPRGCGADPCANTTPDLKDVEHLLQTASCTGALACRHPACVHRKAGRRPRAKAARIEKHCHWTAAFLRGFKFLLLLYAKWNKLVFSSIFILASWDQRSNYLLFFFFKYLFFNKLDILLWLKSLLKKTPPKQLMFNNEINNMSFW